MLGNPQIILGSPCIYSDFIVIRGKTMMMEECSDRPSGQLPPDLDPDRTIACVKCMVRAQSVTTVV